MLFVYVCEFSFAVVLTHAFLQNLKIFSKNLIFLKYANTFKETAAMLTDIVNRSRSENPFNHKLQA